jgi:hypothetical protein
MASQPPRTTGPARREARSCCARFASAAIASGGQCESLALRNEKDRKAFSGPADERARKQNRLDIFLQFSYP